MDEVAPDPTRSPNDWQTAHPDKMRTAAQAVAKIAAGQRVFVGSGAAVPLPLLEALSARASELHDTELMHILTLGMDPTAAEHCSQHLRHASFFLGGNTRQAVAECRADYSPIFLSEIPRLFKTGAIPIDVALVQVSPPDRHGFCSYGVSVDIVKSATEAARTVIAEVNPRMPRTLGDSFLHVRDIDLMVPSERPLVEHPSRPLDDVSRRIGRYVASLIEDGSTLQLGIGAIPDAVLANLGDRRDLGIHTEMFSDGLLPLIASGVVNNRRKTFHRGKIVTSFVMGSRALYDFVDDNPEIEFRPSQYTNDPFLIARNDRMVAINSALEVDLTGQVCADSIGYRFYSGIGGQVDFVRGAGRSNGGKPVIALPSTAKDGTVSRIVAQLSDGAGVVTTRGDVHYVVTEHGVAYLHGKSIRQRTIALIAIAHPRFRNELLDRAKARGYLESDQVVITGSASGATSSYPIELEETVELRGGERVLLRPLKETDEDHLKQLFYDESDRSRYYRFLSTAKFLPRRALQSLAHIDFAVAMALCAVKDPGPAERLLGVARYYRDQRTALAEFAILVHDAWHGRGIGTALMTKLIAIARQRGVRGFTAEILADNHQMFELLEGLGVRRKTTLEDGVAHVEFLFDAESEGGEGPPPAAAPPG